MGREKTEGKMEKGSKTIYRLCENVDNLRVSQSMFCDFRSPCASHSPLVKDS